MNGTKRRLLPDRFKHDWSENVSAPVGLETYTFEVGGDEYCLFELDFGQVTVPAQLTRAEREVTSLVLEGRSNEQIATARGTSSFTVANQLQSVYAKLGVSGRTELIAYCVESARLGAQVLGEVRE